MLTKKYIITMSITKVEIVGLIILALTCIGALYIGYGLDGPVGARAVVNLFY